MALLTTQHPNLSFADISVMHAGAVRCPACLLFHGNFYICKTLFAFAALLSMLPSLPCHALCIQRSTQPLALYINSVALAYSHGKERASGVHSPAPAAHFPHRRGPC